MSLTETVLFVAHVAIVGALAGVTVTVNSQFDPAALVQETTVLPTGKTEPDTGLQETAPQSPLDAGD
jgi:hypothetical protein